MADRNLQRGNYLSAATSALGAVASPLNAFRSRSGFVDAARGIQKARGTSSIGELGVDLAADAANIDFRLASPSADFLS